MALLDLVALGTVCDVMPLVGLNRVLVSSRLARDSPTKQPGVRHPGRGGRDRGPWRPIIWAISLGRASTRADGSARLRWERACSAPTDPDEARRLAEALDGFNADRREIEAQVLMEAIEQVESTPGGEGEHPAGHGGRGGLAPRGHRHRRQPVAGTVWPACLCLAIDGTLAKGSGRSVAGLDLGAAVLAARDAGLLMLGGGHAMAAGFTLARPGCTTCGPFWDRHLAGQLTDGVLDPCAWTWTAWSASRGPPSTCCGH